MAPTFAPPPSPHAPSLEEYLLQPRMSPTTASAPCCGHHAAAVDAIPRTPSAAVNLAHLQECCKHHEDVDTSGIEHPHAPFMERAIYLSRVAGLEKRTGACIPLPGSGRGAGRASRPAAARNAACTLALNHRNPACLAGGCFGAVVVKNGKIVGEGYNNVISRNDPTWCATRWPSGHCTA